MRNKLYYNNFRDGVLGDLFHGNDADGNLALLHNGLAPTAMLPDMLPTGLHGAELADIQHGDSVLAMGIGSVGLMRGAGAALRGASGICAVGSRDVCVAAAKGYGANHSSTATATSSRMDHTRGVANAIIAGGENTFAEVRIRMKNKPRDRSKPVIIS